MYVKVAGSQTHELLIASPTPKTTPHLTMTATQKPFNAAAFTGQLKLSGIFDCRVPIYT